MKKAIHGILIGAASALIAIALHSAQKLDWIENVTWDWRVRQQAQVSESSSKIKLVFLDQNSLDWGAHEDRQLPWPWPRSVYAPALNFFQRGGAKAVAFDIVFTEQSQMGVEDDQALGASVRDFGKYIQAFHLVNKGGSSETWPKDIPTTKFEVHSNTTSQDAISWNMPHFPMADFPIPEIATKAAVLGNVSAKMERDAIIRRSLLLSMFDNRVVPSLSIAAYLAVHPDAQINIKNRGFFLGDRFIPMDENGRAIINFRGKSQTHETYSLSAVINSELRILEELDPEIDPLIFKDAYVFVGMTAAGLRDLRPTPISKEYPGVEIHATMLDNLLANDFISDASTAKIIAFTFIFSILAGLCGRFSPNWQFATLLFALLLPLPMVVGMSAYSENTWLPVAPPIVSVAMALVGALIVNYAIEGKQKRFIKNAFRQYLSPIFIEKLVKDPNQLKLGGEKRELSIYFSDVQGFTSISESLEPEELTALLNDYLSAMTSIVHEQGGTIDKYEGDAIIAFWNAPLDDIEHARNCVRAALLGQEKLTELRPEFKERIGKDMFARIGINTGPVVVGNMGSEQRFDYTFLGDAGNLAARLEGINKQFGTFLMISENTLNELDDEFTYRELSKVQVVGRKEPVRVYEPYFTEKADKEFIASFSKALNLYYDGKFDDAIKAFEYLSEKDSTSVKYIARCQHLIENPPEAWNGVWTMTEK